MNAIIFDFDGTIIDTETAWYNIYREVLIEDYNYDLKLESFLTIVGTTDEVLFDFIDKSLDTPLNREHFNKRIQSQFHENRGQLQLRPGVMDFILYLQKMDIHLGIASSSNREWVTGFLKDFDLTSYFPVVRTADDVDVVKPDPALYLKAVNDFDIPTENALAIEDSVNGSLAALKAGIHCFVIPNTITQELTFPDKVVIFDSFENKIITEEIEKWSAQFYK